MFREIVIMMNLLLMFFILIYFLVARTVYFLNGGFRNKCEILEIANSSAKNGIRKKIFLTIHLLLLGRRVSFFYHFSRKIRFITFILEMSNECCISI